jgi:DNA-binding transcriptional regulator YdaS (Cro superfamily)
MMTKVIILDMNMIDLLKESLPKTQAEAGRLLQVSQTTIHKWMTGKAKPSAKSAIRIEKLTHGKVTRNALRPDIFGPAPDSSAKSKRCNLPKSERRNVARRSCDRTSTHERPLCPLILNPKP